MQINTCCQEISKSIFTNFVKSLPTGTEDLMKNSKISKAYITVAMMGEFGSRKMLEYLNDHLMADSARARGSFVAQYGKEPGKEKMKIGAAPGGRSAAFTAKVLQKDSTAITQFKHNIQVIKNHIKVGESFIDETEFAPMRDSLFASMKTKNISSTASALLAIKTKAEANFKKVQDATLATNFSNSPLNNGGAGGGKLQVAVKEQVVTPNKLAVGNYTDQMAKLKGYCPNFNFITGVGSLPSNATNMAPNINMP